jgi:glycosyltransferase involved in cell wall biosynthesis
VRRSAGVSKPAVLRIGFDGRDVLRKRTGVVNYAVHLAARQATLANNSQARPARPAEETVHAQPQPVARLARQERAAIRAAEFIVYADHFVDPQVSSPNGVDLRRLNAPPVAWKHIALPLALLRDRVDVFHSPTGTLPLLAPCRQIVTIHDLFAAIGPEWFPPRMARQLNLAQRRSVRTANAVIAVSHRTRRDLLERFGVPEANMHVIYNGVDHSRLRPKAVDAEQLARRYGVPYPFVLCVGSLMPWRNGPRLLRAVARLRDTPGGKFGLLFVGRDIWATDPTARIVSEHGWSWARFAGYVPDEELAALYSAARVFAYPSLYEGFGIPPLEAMACGTPVVASSAGALPEVLGDAALLVDPYDEDGLAQALLAAAEDQGRLRTHGLARAAEFDWSKTAEQTWQVYQRTADAPPSGMIRQAFSGERFP